ncbi:MAG TPA: fused MFS/spermidine synthase [Polyangiales bacterium]|nr:fused MFS/spermidine synthase [Polyangiales bacterium]
MAAELEARSYQRRGRLLALAAFSSAFLTFSVQPLLAKWLLPGLGGSPATWASCMLFFQGMLVLGYLAAHVARGRSFYALLAVVALAAALWRHQLGALPTGLERSPVWRVLGVLAVQVGAQYLLLSSVAPQVQRWAAGMPERAVQRLYAVSNAGSLSALLAYPVLIEPAFGLGQQWLAWSCASAALAGLMLWLGSQHAGQDAAAPEPPSGDRVSHLRRVRWVCYASLPTALLLATTNYLTTDIAAVPLLWVLPLSVYLATFIAAFGGAGPRTGKLALAVFLITSVASGWHAFAPVTAPLWSQLSVSLSVLGSAALLCHMELVRERPAHAELTEYYVWIALGGVLGSAAVALLAPSLFTDYYELELAVLATYVLLALRGERAPRDDLQVPGLRRSPERLLVWLGLGLCGPVLLISLWLRVQASTREGQVIDRRRNFLGAIRVTQFDVGRVLTHGRIRHGMQLAGAGRRLPTMYYGPGTAIQRVFANHKPRPVRTIGVVGLGAGTIAALGTRQDWLRFYELDPQVIDVARSQFTFLGDSPAQIETRLGDGRLLLAADAQTRFDILVLDAFASDAVPVHLLTREAFALYLSRLLPDGVLLANVANRHISVDRVVRGAARAQGLDCAVVETEADPEHFVSKVRWAVCARRADQLSVLLSGMKRATEPLPDVVWTDAHASLWSVLH